MLTFGVRQKGFVIICISLLWIVFVTVSEQRKDLNSHYASLILLNRIISVACLKLCFESRILRVVLCTSL